MINGAFDTLTDSIANGEFSFSTFLSVLLSMVSAIPMVVTGYTQLADAIKKAKGAQDAEAVSGKKGALIKGVQTLASKLFKKAKKDETNEVEKGNMRQNKSNLLSALFGIGK
jgi:hypothetical protein